MGGITPIARLVRLGSGRNPARHRALRHTPEGAACATPPRRTIQNIDIEELACLDDLCSHCCIFGRWRRIATGMVG